MFSFQRPQNSTNDSPETNNYSFTEWVNSTSGVFEETVRHKALLKITDS